MGSYNAGPGDHRTGRHRQSHTVIALEPRPSTPGSRSATSPQPTVETLYRGLADNTVGKNIESLLRVRFLPEQTTAVSILDRLLHHATVVITDGDSYRMKRRRTPKGEPQTNLRTTAPGGYFHPAISGYFDLALDSGKSRSSCDVGVVEAVVDGVCRSCRAGADRIDCGRWCRHIGCRTACRGATADSGTGSPRSGLTDLPMSRALVGLCRQYAGGRSTGAPGVRLTRGIACPQGGLLRRNGSRCAQSSLTPEVILAGLRGI